MTKRNAAFIISVILLFILGLNSKSWGGSSTALLDISAVLLGGIGLLWSRRRGIVPLDVAIVSFILLIFVGSQLSLIYYADDYTSIIRSGVRWLIILGMALGLCYIGNEASDQNIWLIALIASISGAMIVFPSNSLDDFNFEASGIFRLRAGATFVLAWIPFFIFRRRSFLNRVAYVAMSIFVVLTYSRAAWLACIVSIMVSSILEGRIKQMLKVILSLIFSMLLVSIIFPFATERVNMLRIDDPENVASSTYNRLYRLVNAVDAFGANPITGIGGGRLIDHLLESTNSDLSLFREIAIRRDLRGVVPHNLYLELFAEGGILTGTAFIALNARMGYICFNAYTKATNNSSKDLALYFILAFIVMNIYFLTGYISGPIRLSMACLVAGVSRLKNVSCTPLKN